MPPVKMQQYPRRDDYLAQDKLFPPPNRRLSKETLTKAIHVAFERSISDKQGNAMPSTAGPGELVNMCIAHLRERSDPILSPFFLSQCRIEEVFELDAVAHEMQRHRMKIGTFYQFLIVELMRCRFATVADGKREGDLEAEIDTPGFAKGLHLLMSIKKSADTVGGQDISGVIRRLESVALEDKNLTRPYLCVVCYTTPHRGIVLPYKQARSVRRNRDGHPYSPNCEVWGPGFIFPFISGLEAQNVYKSALQTVGQFFPFRSLSQRKLCGGLLANELKKLGLVNRRTNRIDSQKFQKFICKKKSLGAHRGQEDEGNPDE